VDQPLLHGHREAFADRQLRVGHLLAEGARQRHGQHACQAGRQADGDAPGECAAHPAQLFAGALHLVQDAAGMLQQQLAGLGGHGAAAVAHQQVLAQFHLQQAHLAAQRRLGNVQCNRGPGEAAQLGHAHKVFELLEIHAPPVSLFV
jgi:hypothetical protein